MTRATRALPVVSVVAMLLTMVVAGSLRAQDVVSRRREKIAIAWSELETSKKSYRIQYESVIPRATVEKVAKELEEVLAVYVKLFRHKPKEQLRVKFLDSPNTYEQEGGDPSHPAHYNPRTEHLVIRQMAFYQLFPTIYHEAFHQYLHVYVGKEVHVPIWFNEGMAVYYEGMQRERNKRNPKLDPEQVNIRRIRMVKSAIFSRTAIPFTTLIDATHEDFHDKDKETLYYNQSFAVIYFLMKASGGKLPARYMLEMKKTKGDVEAANAKLFGRKRRNLESLERKWKGFIAKLEIPDK